MHFNDEFRDKSVIVTGTAEGIGKETALRFAAAGRMAGKTAKIFGGIDVLVNCAGISGFRLRNISKTEDQEWDITGQAINVDSGAVMHG